MQKLTTGQAKDLASLFYPYIMDYCRTHEAEYIQFLERTQHTDPEARAELERLRSAEKGV